MLAEFEARQQRDEARKGGDETVTPRGAGAKLPPLPDEVTITDDDIDAAFALWNRLMRPEERGQLNAEVKHG